MLQRRRWWVLFALTALFSIAGLFMSSHAGDFNLSDKLQARDYANIAWMITATIFVLMMTP